MAAGAWRARSRGGGAAEARAACVRADGRAAAAGHDPISNLAVSLAARAG